MSKRGKEYAELLADSYLRHSPGITKAAGASANANAGTREALAERFAPEGEFLAQVSKLLDANDKLLKRMKESDRQAEVALAELRETYSHCEAMSKVVLGKAESYTGERLPPFVPDEWEIVNRVNGMISRNMAANGNGNHAAPHPD